MKRAIKYGIVIEKAARNYSAYVPDLPGCIATGRNLPEVRQNIQDAIELHLEGMRQDGDAIPKPRTLCEYIETAVEAA